MRVEAFPQAIFKAGVESGPETVVPVGPVGIAHAGGQKIVVTLSTLTAFHDAANSPPSALDGLGTTSRTPPPG